MLNDEIKDYWEGESYVYSDIIKKSLDDEGKNAWADLVLGNAPKKEKLEILDVGTGPGFFPVLLGEKGHHVTGIDITENMIRRAAENISAAGVKADLAVMDCQNIQYHDESFDLVVCRDLTWTLADPVKAYKEWTRVLRKGGVLLVFDACWYLHLFDEKRMKVFEEDNNNLRKK